MRCSAAPATTMRSAGRSPIPAVGEPNPFDPAPVDLPVSRFGLDEVLDLLASAPMAEASGWDGDAIDRLHGWLREAGARGLEYRVRLRCAGPTTPTPGSSRWTCWATRAAAKTR